MFGVGQQDVRGRMFFHIVVVRSCGAWKSKWAEFVFVSHRAPARRTSHLSCRCQLGLSSHTQFRRDDHAVQRCESRGGPPCTSTRMGINSNVFFETWMLTRSRLCSPQCTIRSTVFRRRIVLSARPTGRDRSLWTSCTLLDHGNNNTPKCLSSQILF